MTGLYLIARFAGRTVAIASEQVHSVVDISKVTPVPRSPPFVRGLAALRSRVVTVIDTPVALGFPGSGSARRAVTVHVDGHSYAMLVDALEDVAPFALHPLANGLALAPAWRSIALGLIDRDGVPVLAVDLLGLLPTSTAVAA